jgi:transposase
MADATRAAQVAEWRASGLSAEKFCEGRGFKPHRLWNWAAKIRKEEQQSGRLDATEARSVRMARVVRVPLPAPDKARRAGVALSVELCGVRVVVPPGFDRATLAAVLAAIEMRGQAGADKQ